MGGFLKWFINNIDNKELIGIIEKSKIRINGFSKLKIVNGKINVPRNIIEKAISDKNNYEKFCNSICDNEIESEYKNYTDKKIVEKINSEYELIRTIKFLLSEKEKWDLLDIIIGKIDFNTSIKEQEFITEYIDIKEKAINNKNSDLEFKLKMKTLSDENKSLKKKNIKLE